MSARVSVIIPTHNRAALLGRALDSVLAQTRPPEEILVVDDGSTDATPQLLRQRYPGVRCLRQRHAGVSAARNLGIARASAPWLAFLDSDDEWLPAKLEAQLQALEHEPGIRVVHTDEIWLRRGVRINPKHKHRKYGGRIFRRCLPLCAISPSAALIHREVFAACGAFDPALPACEDYDLWLRICARYPVHLVAQALVVKHGGHADQLSRRHWGMDRFRIRALVRVLDAGVLDAADRAAAAATLCRKLDIFVQGAEKRGRHAEVTHYRKLRRRYQHLTGAGHA